MRNFWLLLTFAFTLSGLAAVPPVRPNVLFIAVDDLRPTLGCYGDPVAITPHLDRLAARGTVFGRAYCQQAVCNASRQSLLSGRRPDSIRVWDLHTVFRETRPEVVSLPEHFKANGYFTQSFGKIYHDGRPDPQSWTVPAQFEVMPKREDYRTPENRQTRPGGGQKGAAVEFADAPEDAYPDGKVASGAVAALEKFGGKIAQQPFFLAVGIRKPHLPFTAPKKYWELYDPHKFPPIVRPDPPRGGPAIAMHNSEELRGYRDQPRSGPWSSDQSATLRRGYYAAMSFADAQIGRVLAALERTGLERNTIVVVWGDHGYHLGEHRLWTKTTNYEADTRVPLLIAAPGKKGGQRTNALVELLDLYPTLIELCDLSPAPKLEGRSLAKNLGDPAATGRPAAFSQFPRPWASRTRITRPEIMGYAVRTATHRYVEWRDLGTSSVMARELYAYAGDELFERINLVAEPASKIIMVRLAALIPAPPETPNVSP